MAFPTQNQTSSIAMALAGMSGSVTIPKPRETALWSGKDSFAAVVARSMPTSKGRQAGLPTPPNSISPTLPPQAFKEHGSVHPPTPPAHNGMDSDIDLLDAVEHAQAQDQSQHGLPAGSLAGFETAGAITPAMLAKHYLPDILLNNGPLAIRHVMGYLTTSVPGFSGIPPAKARRLVVGALEGRGSGGEGGGLEGDVEFEKVGWGRWDARRRGESPRQDRSTRHHLSPSTSRTPQTSLRSPSPLASQTVRIPHRSRPHHHRHRLYSHSSQHLATSHPSNNSYALSHSHNTPDLDNEHDPLERMSLSGSDDDNDSCSSSIPEESPDLEFDMDDEGDVTDEEDWASIGAAALRAGSFPQKAGGGGGGGKIYTTHNYDYNERARRASSQLRRPGVSRKPSGGSAWLAKSAPQYQHPRVQQQLLRHCTNNIINNKTLNNDDLKEDHDVLMAGQDSQERDAIKALMGLRGV